MGTVLIAKAVAQNSGSRRMATSRSKATAQGRGAGMIRQAAGDAGRAKSRADENLLELITDDLHYEKRIN